jgi:hypothetical protein
MYVRRILLKTYIKSFYTGLPESFFSVKDKEGNVAVDSEDKPLLVVPGEYRTQPVQVGPLPVKVLVNIWAG